MYTNDKDGLIKKMKGYEPTHVVTAIEYGGDAHIIFSRVQKKLRKKNNITFSYSTLQKNSSDSNLKDINAYLHAKLTLNEPPPITVEGHFGLNMSNQDNSSKLDLDIEV